jgi:hypothetical protein
MSYKKVWRIKVGDRLSCVCRDVPLCGTVQSVAKDFAKGVYVVTTDTQTAELNPFCTVEVEP